MPYMLIICEKCGRTIQQYIANEQEEPIKSICTDCIYKIEVSNDK